jgi:hypothetical protein
MHRRLFIAAISTLMFGAVHVLNPQSQEPNPKQMMEQFLTMVKNDSLLTSDGRESTGKDVV